MHAITTHLEQLVALVASRMPRHRIGPRVWLSESGDISPTSERYDDGDPARALQQIEWAAITAALDLAPEALARLGEVTVARYSGTSGRWSMMVGDRLLSPEESILSAIMDAGADVWALALRLRVLAADAGAVAHCEETIARGENG